MKQLGHALALALLGTSLLAGCGRRDGANSAANSPTPASSAPSPTPTPRSSPSNATSPTPQTATATAVATASTAANDHAWQLLGNGTARVERALAAAKNTAASARAAARPWQPQQVSKQTPVQLWQHHHQIVGTILHDAGDKRDVVTVATNGDIKKLRIVDERVSALLQVNDGMYLSSDKGLRWLPLSTHNSATADQKLPAPVFAGRLTKAARVADNIVWAACVEEGSCSVGRFQLASKTITAIVASGFDVVSGVTMWRNHIYLAGRFRHSQEGVPLSPESLRAHVKWLSSRGGPAPANARYAPGLLAKIAVDSGKVSFWIFPDQRPANIVADAQGLYLLTGGSLRTMFSDGVLLQIAPNEEWKVLASHLATPDDLTINDTRICLDTMPGRRFEVVCHHRASGTTSVPVSREWNVLAFAENDAGLWVSVMTKGLFRYRAPTGGR